MNVEKVPFICDKCWNSIELIKKPFCDICGKPIIINLAKICPACRNILPIFSKARAVARYNKSMRQVIHLLKYEKKMVMLKFIKPLIEETLPNLLVINDYDYLLPVPLHKKRLKERGFNQAEFIARLLEEISGVKMDYRNLIRVRNTLPQSSLKTSQEKHENVHDAFILRNPEKIKRKKILIVDDILTTGATVSEITKILLEAEAGKVDVFTLANAG